MARDRFPFPVPFGWYSAGYDDELPAGTVTARRLCGRDLIVWRGEDGTAHVMDAYCPHLGAHLGVGGGVRDGTVVCPFHGWAFDGDGRNVDIPYSSRTNARARIRTYPTVERNHMVLFWYHPDPTVEPMWEIPEIPALADGYAVRYRWEVDAPWQVIAENSVDAAHFQFVHGLVQPGEIVEASFDFPVRRQKIVNRYNTKQGPYEGWQETVTYGPGFGTTQFHIFGDAHLIASLVPIERDRTLARFAWVYGDDPASQATGPRFADEVERQFEQDIPIWEAMRYEERPALASSEGAITKFRAWAARFYAEPPRLADDRPETTDTTAPGGTR